MNIRLWVILALLPLSTFAATCGSNYRHLAQTFNLDAAYQANGTRILQSSRGAEFYYGRIEALLESAKEGKFNKTFDKVSPNDIIDLRAAIQGGYLRVEGRTPPAQARAFIEELYRFCIIDAPGVFWQSSEPSVRLQRARTTLRDLMRRSHRAIERREETAEGARNGLTAVERNVIERAVNREGSFPLTMGQRFRQWLFPLYKRVRKIVEVNQALQQEIDYMAWVDEVIRFRGLERAEQEGLTESEVQELQWLVTKTAFDIQNLRQTIEQMYGRLPDPRYGIRARDIDLYRAYRVARDFDMASLHRDFRRQGEGEIRILHRILNQARARQSRPRVNPSEYRPRELQISHQMLQRQLDNWSRRFNTAMTRRIGASYVVHYQYRYTERVWTGNDSNGVPQYRNQTRTRYSSSTNRPSYREIIDNHFPTNHRGTITRIEGLDTIREQVKPVREMEAPFVRTFESARERFLASVEAYGETRGQSTPQGRAAQRTDLADMVSELRDTLRELEGHAKKKERAAERFFPGGNYGDFVERNRSLVQAYRTLIAAIENYSEQVRRNQDSLSLAHSEPEAYERDFETLNRWRGRAVASKWWLFGIAAASTTALIIRHYYLERIRAAEEQEQYEEEERRWQEREQERRRLRDRRFNNNQAPFQAPEPEAHERNDNPPQAEPNADFDFEFDEMGVFWNPEAGRFVAERGDRTFRFYQSRPQWDEAELRELRHTLSLLQAL